MDKKKNYKKTNNDLQNTTQKTKDRHEPYLKLGRGDSDAPEG
jgi:hypothetical protein